MISGGIIGAFIALPTSVLLGQFLGQFADFFKSSSGIIFTLAAVLIPFFSSRAMGQYLNDHPICILHPKLRYD